MERRDDLYPENFSEKGQYKLANLMAHGYELTEVEFGVRVARNNDVLIILPNGEVFKKTIY
ncbi:MAG: hypothetical protein KUG64_10745 [Cycloclasticus sp.]|nr:hypothetical protein [Cycloclasticus sp.]